MSTPSPPSLPLALCTLAASAALACTAATVLAAAAPLGAAPTRPATPTHLSRPAWRTLQRLEHTTTDLARGQCRHFAAGSRDAEARAVVGMCIDEGQAVEWLGRFLQRCLFASGSVTATGCARQVAGVDRNEAGAAAWSRRIAAPLGAGGCRSFWGDLARAQAVQARAGRPLVHDFDHLPGETSRGLTAAVDRWLASFGKGAQRERSHRPTLRRELGDCAPPSSQQQRAGPAQPPDVGA